MRLLSFGEIIWDVYTQEKQTLGGAPLNFAAYAAMLGVSVWLASSVGADELGESAMKQIKELGVKTEYISIADGKATGQCRVSLDPNGVPSYNILQDVAYDRILLPNKLPMAFDTIAFGTLALREEHNREIIKAVLANNIFLEIYTDLNLRSPFYSKESIVFCLSNATIVKISDEELPRILQILFDTTLDFQDAIAAITEKYPQIKLLLITCGAKGAFCYDRLSGKTHYCPSETVSVVSTVGAGDSFGATFLTLYDKTKDIPYSLRRSAQISAFVVSHNEAIPPDCKNFIQKLLYNEKSKIPKIL